jgi:hypothetical protein
MQAATIRAVLSGHTARVNCVRWVPTTGRHVCMSASVSTNLYICICTALCSLSQAITAAGADVLLATGSADASLIIWRIQLDHQDEPWQLLTRLQVPYMLLQSKFPCGQQRLETIHSCAAKC